MVKKNRLSILLISLLFVAAIGRSMIVNPDVSTRMYDLLPTATGFEKLSSDPLSYKAKKQESGGEQTVLGYFTVSTGSGYGGPLKISTVVDSSGVITHVEVEEHKDTPSFMAMLLTKNYLTQFVGLKVSDQKIAQSQVDVLTGATYTSKGVLRAIALAGHQVSKDAFGIITVIPEEPIIFSTKEFVVSGLILTMVVGTFLKWNKLRWITLIGGLFFLGFKFNHQLSISNIASLFLGFFPSFFQHIAWYLIIVFIPLLTLFFGKNIYCFWLCPFGAVQDLLNKISGKNISCHSCVTKKARKVKYVLAYLALLAAIIFANPGIAAYEPFATLFSLNGSTVQWILLPLVIFSAFFISRVWCNYLCPVSPVLETLSRAGLAIRKNLKGRSS